MVGGFILNANWLICDMYILLFTENVKMFVLDFSSIEYVAKFLLYPKLAMAGEEELHGQGCQASSVMSHCLGKAD